MHLPATGPADAESPGIREMLVRGCAGMLAEKLAIRQGQLDPRGRLFRHGRRRDFPKCAGGWIANVSVVALVENSVDRVRTCKLIPGA